MQQLNFIQAGMLEWREAPEPKMETDGDALVRPIIVATRDLDAAVVRGAFPGPFPIGHEGVAEVIDVGDAVGSLGKLGSSFQSADLSRY